MKKLNDLAKIIIRFLFKSLSQITPFDLYLIIFFLLGIVGLWRFLGSKSSWHEIRVEVVSRGWEENESSIYGVRVPFWLHDNLSAGMVEKDNFGRKTAEIKSIDSYERGSEEAVTYLVISVKTKYDEKTGTHVYNGIPLAIGKNIDFLFNDVYVPGQITDSFYSESNFAPNFFKVKIKGRGQDAFIADAINEGDTIKKYKNDDVILKVINLSILPSSLGRIYRTGNEILLQDDSNQVDIEMEVMLKAENINNRWYFAGHQQLKIGNGLWLYFPNYNLTSMTIEELTPLGSNEVF